LGTCHILTGNHRSDQSGEKNDETTTNHATSITRETCGGPTRRIPVGPGEFKRLPQLDFDVFEL